MSSNTKEYIIGELAKPFIPLQDALSSNDAFETFMAQFGYVINTIPAPIMSLYTKVTDLQAAVAPIIGGTATSSDYLTAAGDLVALVAAIQNLSTGNFSAYPQLGSNFATVFPKQLIDFLIISYFEGEHPVFASVLRILSIFQVNYTLPADTRNRQSYYAKTILWSNITALIQNPGSVLTNAYNWGDSQNEYGIANLLSGAQQLFEGLGTISQVGRVDYQLARKIEEDNSIPAGSIHYSLDMLFYLKTLVSGSLSAGIGVYPLAPKTGRKPGVAFLPYVNGQYTVKTSLFDSLFLQITSTLNMQSGLAVIFRPNERMKIITDLSGSGTASNGGELKIDLINEDASGKSILLFGSEGGTNFKYKTLSLSTGLNLRMPDVEDLFIELQIDGAELNIGGGEGDSFIQKIIPVGGVKSKINFLIGFSSKRGLYFNTSGGVEIKIPNHIQIGPLEVSSIVISAMPKNGSLPINIAADLKVKMGPIDATVTNIGARGTFTFPGSGGNIGPVNLDLGFKPPTGIGLAINASAVKGGGFLNYDEATWTYTGGLELSFSKISFSAIGIVSTKLPGGKPGYSLLIIISAEFTPIQLGMGFTLNGIGGILGLNRTMNPDVLRNGIRDNTLDSILFPKDIVKNANTIISNIGQAFPAKEGQFLIGPMAKIGWGTPTLLTIELGIIIELPEPVRLAILGVVKALLPSKDNAIVKIQVNFLGIIDFTNKYLSFDASLYDSKILTFGLFGDMALRLYWGNKPNFLLSVGGFHPKFTPPPMNLPELRRLTIVLANQDNLKISVETYFAITSNSVQFGAKVAAMAKAWKIQAIGALWFDILFQFKPFYFIADMGVMFAIKMGSKTILSLYVNLTLEGPNPWRARGKGSFKVLFVKVSVSFDKTFGQARVEAIQAEAIDGRVKAALTNRDNWEALLPARSHELISWREEDISNPATEISVDPAGSLKINQRLIPLQTTMSKFGSSAISDYKRYDITSVKAGTDTLPKQTIQDNFARNEFFYMTDDEKLSRSSYELFDSGVIVGSDKIDSQYAVHSACHYEEITLDAGYRRPEPIYALSANLFGLHRFGNYISRSGLSDFDRITTSVGPNRVKVDLQKEEFVLIDRNNMNEVSGYFSNSAAAQQYLTAQQAGSPATAGNWIVANRFEL